MAKNDYAEGRKKHLAKYAIEKGLKCCGLWREKPYCHILFTENEEQKKGAIKKNLLKGVKADMLAKPHTDAHHLNSSQILCYNFFRPLIDKNGCHKLVEFLRGVGVDIGAVKECHFEHNDHKGDGTEIDFYVRGQKESGEEVEIFIEVKYTENSLRCSEAFGKKSATYQRKYEEVYVGKGLFYNQKCLQKVPSFKDFYTYYQCFRNVLRVTNENKYTLFIYPKENEIAKNFQEFHDGWVDSKNVILVKWEDLVKEGELYEKYFAE